MFESLLNNDSAPCAAVIAAWRAWLAWRARTPPLFLLGFLFSSAVGFPLARGAAAQFTALVRSLALLFHFDPFVFILDCDFNILTMAYYVFNESSCALKTWSAQSWAGAALARPVSSRLIAACSTVLNLTWAVATHSLNLPWSAESGHSIVPIPCLFDYAMKCWVSK